MFLVGYSIDFFSWVWSKVLPDGLFDSMAVRLGVLLPALAVFVVAAGVYMVTELGNCPLRCYPVSDCEGAEKGTVPRGAHGI